MNMRMSIDKNVMPCMRNSPIFDKGMDDDYWTYIEKPIFYVSREGSVDLETLGNLDMEEQYVEF